MMFGSTTHHVIRESPLPVLTIRGRRGGSAEHAHVGALAL
jgi:precorrin isomerase